MAEIFEENKRLKYILIVVIAIFAIAVIVGVLFFRKRTTQISPSPSPPPSSSPSPSISSYVIVQYSGNSITSPVMTNQSPKASVSVTLSPNTTYTFTLNFVIQNGVPSSTYYVFFQGNPNPQATIVTNANGTGGTQFQFQIITTSTPVSNVPYVFNIQGPGISNSNNNQFTFTIFVTVS